MVVVVVGCALVVVTGAVVAVVGAVVVVVGAVVVVPLAGGMPPPPPGGTPPPPPPPGGEAGLTVTLAWAGAAGEYSALPAWLASRTHVPVPRILKRPSPPSYEVKLPSTPPSNTMWSTPWPARPQRSRDLSRPTCPTA